MINGVLNEISPIGSVTRVLNRVLFVYRECPSIDSSVNNIIYFREERKKKNNRF